MPLPPSIRGRFPSIVLGTAQLGSVVPTAMVPASARQRSERWLDEMFELGCTTIDTAASYMLGGTERALGQWMAARGNRERLFLITKGGHPYPIVKPNRLSPKDLKADLHDSLRRLGTDRVDLYVLHRDDPGAPIEPMLEMLLEHQRRGELLSYGVSSWTHDRIAALIALAERWGAPLPAASSPHFSLLEWSRPPWKGCVSIAGGATAERDFYASHQLPVLAWSPLGSGYFAHKSGGSAAVYETAINEGRRARAEALARRQGLTAAQVALAYLFSQPFPVSAIVATGSAANMRLDLAAATQVLSAADAKWLESGDAAFG